MKIGQPEVGERARTPDRMTDKQTNRQTDRQTDTSTDNKGRLDLSGDARANKSPYPSNGNKTVSVLYTVHTGYRYLFLT